MKKQEKLTRKEFIQTTGLLTAGAMISPAVLKGIQPGNLQKKIRVGVIGCGSVSNSYLPNLSACPFAEIVSACDIRYERALAQAERFSIPHTYPTLTG